MNTWHEKNILKVKGDRKFQELDELDSEKLRTEIEPWLTALFQSEHFSLLLGSGLSSAVHHLAKGEPGADMGRIKFSVFAEQMAGFVKVAANKLGRGDGNIEDQIRIANDLSRGLEIYTSSNVYGSKKLKKKISKFKQELNSGMLNFLIDILQAEKNIITASDSEAAEYLMNFLISFSSRSGTRERLNIFTTNYDRIIEFGTELAGIRLLDHFVGTVNPIFRSSRLNVDMHYNPPGIRGEPRYLEGVVYFTKLHGSLDWYYTNDIVRRISVPFGSENLESYFPKEEGRSSSAQAVMIYPNSSKDRETSEYPYVELFRDLAASVCRPNSTLILYGYGFGDEHINRVIKDMITIPSTHLVIISYGDENDRIQKFYQDLKRPAQVSLLIGSHFGDLKVLVDNYLPKPAIDRTTFRMVELLKSRGYPFDGKKNEGGAE